MYAYLRNFLNKKTKFTFILAHYVSTSSQEYSMYFSQSLNLLYDNLFGSLKMPKKYDLADNGNDSMDWEPVSNFILVTLISIILIFLDMNSSDKVKNYQGCA